MIRGFPGKKRTLEITMPAGIPSLRKLQVLGLVFCLNSVFTPQAFCQKTNPNVSDRKSARQDPMRVTPNKIAAWARSVGISTTARFPRQTLATSQEIRLRWNTHISPAGTQTAQAAPQRTSGEFLTVTQIKLKAEPVARQRAPRISSEKIMIFTLDPHGVLLQWLLIPDPRILRAEIPDAQGRLSGQVLQHQNPEFLVQLPYDPRTTELRFYHPHWTGQAYILKFLATVSTQ